MSFRQDHIQYNISELANSDLFDIVKHHLNNNTFDDDIITHIYNALKAIAWLHKQGFIHRDIKMENFLLFNHTVKLIDFEFTLYAGERQYTTSRCRAGTIPYLPPELGVKLKQYHVYYTSDSFSFAKSFLVSLQLIEQGHLQRQIYQRVFKPMLRNSPRSRPYIKDSREIMKQTLMNQYYEY